MRGSSKSATLNICDLVAHLTVFNGRTSDSCTFEKMSVKSATILKPYNVSVLR